MARASRSNSRGTSVGFVPPFGSRVVGRFSDELIWSVQMVGNLIGSVGRWAGFRGVRFARRLGFRKE
jgi:hypothetical protein